MHSREVFSVIPQSFRRKASVLNKPLFRTTISPDPIPGSDEDRNESRFAKEILDFTSDVQLAITTILSLEAYILFSAIK